MVKTTNSVSEADFNSLSQKYGIPRSVDKGSLKFLYHYTDVTGLFNIVKDNCLWATHYKFLNDNTELRWALSRAKYFLEKKRRFQKSAFVSAFIDEALSRIDANNSPFEAYLLCLSSERDSLSQWRAYGGRKGYAIGIDFEDLSVMSFPIVEHSWFVKVEYNKSTQDTVISTAINEVFALLRRAEKNNQRISKEWARLYFDVIVAELSIYFKHPAFKDEAEWRMVLVQPTDGVSYRPTNRGLVPYLNIAFPLGGQPRVPIKSVRLGPGADPMKEGIEVKRFMAQHEHDAISVTYAAAPVEQNI